MKKKKVSVVIPTFNEKGNAARLASRLLFLGKKHSLDVEVVIVDDDSQDGTGKHLKNKFKGNPKVRVFIRKNERGLSTAILHGIRKSRGNIVVGMDADFNHDPDLLPTLIQGLSGSQLSVASRLARGGGMQDWKRIFPTYVFNSFLKLVLGFPTMDNMSGYYAIRRRHLFSFPLEQIYRGYGEYHLRLLYLAKKAGLTIAEIPYYSPLRTRGRSKSKLVHMFFNYLKVAFRLYFDREIRQGIVS
jgi:dolichol-phosphate mannosyltransferase